MNTFRPPVKQTKRGIWKMFQGKSRGFYYQRLDRKEPMYTRPQSSSKHVFFCTRMGFFALFH